MPESVVGGQILPERHPVTACACEDRIALAGDELITVRVEKGLVTAVICGPPDVLEPREQRPRDHRVMDNRDVERARFASSRPDEERVGDPVPIRLGGAVKVHLYLCIKEGVEPVIRDDRVDAGLPAVAEDSHEPVAGVEGLRSVVLRPAHDVIERVVHVDRQALERKRPQSVVQRRDRRRDL